MNTNTLDGKDCVISIGDMQLTGKNIYVKSLSINASAGFEKTVKLGDMGKSLIQPPQDYTIDFSLVCHNLTQMISKIDPGQVIQIRTKKVDECTVSELLFAINHKMKEVKT